MQDFGVMKGAARSARLERNTLGLRGPAYDELLTRLDERSDDAEAERHRMFTRIPFADPLVRVAIEGQQARREMTLACRNLSRGGIGLLHSSFIHTGTAVTVYLAKADGGAPGLRGKVVRVEHRGGVVHEVGVKFDREINPRDYVKADVCETLPSFEKVDPESLEGRVVYVTACADARSRFEDDLVGTSLEVAFAESFEEAVQRAGSAPEMMFIDIDLPGQSGPELLKKLRTGGFVRPAALVGEPGAGVSRSLVRACGADALVGTPWERDDLLRVLGEFLLSGWDPDQLDRARSRIDRGTLVSLCSELGRLGERMAAQSEDRVGLFATCQQVASLSLMVGMQGVTSMAERLAAQAAEGEAPQDLFEQVRLGCAAAGRAAAA